MPFAQTLRRSALVAVLVAAPLAAQDAPEVVTKFTADFGYVTTSGNSQVTTMSVGEKLTQSRGRWAFEQTFNLVYGEQEGIVNTNFLKASLRGDYTIDKFFALFITGAFDRNTFAGIERRFEEQIGLQLRALAAPRDTVRLEGGAAITQQIAVGGAQTNFPSARAAGAWRHNFSPASYFQQNVEFLPNLKETDDWRVNTESSLVAPISARIGMKLSYVVRFDNVPEPTFKNTDRLFTTGIQLTF
jgi:putative salt-induced outer membrane protein